MAIKNLAIFDIDGTLHKTEVMSLASFRVVCAEYALPVPDMQTLYQTYGANEQTLMDLLGAPQDEAYRKRFYARIDEEESRQMRLVGQCYEGVLESLRKLRDADVTLALCSMCSSRYLETFCDHFGLRDEIAFWRTEAWGSDKRLVLADLLQEAKPERAVMVGDRAYDLLAAEYNGLAFIGCTYGYAPHEIARADCLISSGAELAQAVLHALAPETPNFV